MPRKTVDISQAAEGYLEALRYNGVDHVFGSPGSDDAPFWHHIDRRQREDVGPAYIVCRHEELAMDMAKGYAAVTGRPQAVKLHVTVGPLKAAMSLWGAYHASIPLILLSSHTSTHEGELDGGTPGPHYLDFAYPGGHESNFSGYTKWGITPETNENIGEYFGRAFRIARAQPPGPVYLNLARELTYESRSEMEVVRHTPPEPSPPDGATVQAVAERLVAAEAPLLVVGRLGTDTPTVRETRDELVALAESVGAGIHEGFKWHNNAPMDHDLYLGSSHTGINNTVEDYPTGEVDFVLVIDSERPWYPPAGAAPEADIAILNREAPHHKHLYWNYPAGILSACVPSATVPLLAETTEDTEPTVPARWRKLHDQWRSTWTERAREGQDSSPVDPYRLASVVDDAIPDNAIVVNETVTHGSIVTNLVGDADDRLFLSAEKMSAGGLGAGLGVALGAKLADEDRTAVVLMGDGSFNYNPLPAAFGAAQEHGLPLLVVIFDNRGYRAMEHAVDEAETPAYGTEIEPKPDYERLVSAWDVHGRTVESSAQLQEALGTALDVVRREERSAVLDVELPRESPPLPSYD